MPLTKRIIPCLDVKDGKVVKGVQFRNHEIVGDIVELAKRYSQAGADELVFYDITASSDQRRVDYHWVEQIAAEIDIPFCVAGGIRDTDTARQVLMAGADKISINSPALERPELIADMVQVFGQQCVVIGIDSFEKAGDYWVYQYAGDPDKMQAANLRTVDWVRQVARFGAGEIVLNCMNQDGVRQGYDINQLQHIRQLVTVPLIASGGAGQMSHFAEIFEQTGVDGALAASVFHKGMIDIGQLKQYLAAEGLAVRV